jgi:hypothetical protein
MLRLKFHGVGLLLDQHAVNSMHWPTMMSALLADEVIVIMAGAA